VTTNMDLAAASDSLPPSAIAVVGMAGRFPGAGSISAFWRNLARGEESIVDLSEEDLRAADVGPKALDSPAYVRRAAILKGIDEFDAEFFGFTPQAARMTDPQHRLFLQSAWHALEDAGYDPAHIGGSVGVYGTSSTSGYLLHNLMSHHSSHAIIGQGATFDMVNLSLQNDKDHLATRAAHQFNLRGPALSVQTACSSSLVAVHLACQSILTGECDMALAGAASIRIPHHVGYWHEPGSMVSATGHCRPFDARSDGTIFGSGVAVVVLKSLQAAVDAGDRIHAVIRGSAINNDGSSKMTYAAPNAAGQAEVIAEAHAVAGVDSSTIGYVETHGTGTPLGDPIEIEGLRQAFELSEVDRSGPCILGSVKSNIGHLEVAAGMAGLIKTILCLKHRAIPATLHFTTPNPELHLNHGPFVVRNEFGPWYAEGLRRAGVSSFGVGGTNAHVVLEEPPIVAPSEVSRGPQVLLLSARTPEALDESRSALVAELSGHEDLNLSDVASTLAGRRTENAQLAAVVNDQQHAVEVLRDPEHDNVFVGESVQADHLSTDRIAFLFPGQGSQYVGMAQGLYTSEPVFAEHFDRCAAAFGEELAVDLRAEIFEGAGRNLERTDRAQPALFTVQYALAKLIEAYGVRPAALAGHSIGEYVAATISGVFDLATAVKAVSMRARLMHSSARGVMVAVALSPEAIGEYLSPDVDLAAVNDPGSCVVAGSEENIRRFQDRLAQVGIVARRVRTSHAFHSRLMDPVLAEFTAFMSRLTLCEPQIPLLSNITGSWTSAKEATDPATWARQIRATVRFSDELDVLLADPSRVLVEVGPGGSLSASAMRHPKWQNGHRAVRLMRHHAQNRSDHEAFLLALGQLWSADVDVDWTPRLGRQRRRLLSLPGYPFERQKHWVDYQPTGGSAEQTPATNGIAMPLSAGGADHTHMATSGKASLEETLQRVWAQCLGVNSVDRNANFFELGGDSLVAISVAMSAANEGVDITPQDLYEDQSVAALAKTLLARQTAGGLAQLSPAEAERPPVPPNVAYFLENGLRSAGRWRIPVILKLRADIRVDDIRCVLTAVINHHDALRLKLVERAGTWEQQIAEPQEDIDLATRPLPDGTVPASPQEREAVLEILKKEIAAQSLSSPPLTATYIPSAPGGPSYLAISLHGMVTDNASRDILLADIFTALGQHRAGQDIALQPVTMSWREWSQRCATLATHSAVVESRDFWLRNAQRASLRLAVAEITEPPSADDLARLSSTLTVMETSEIDDARRRLNLSIEDVLLAALSRTIAAVVGDGAIAVDLGGAGRSVLKPTVDLRRTVGWFTAVYPVALNCVKEDDKTARQLVSEVRDTVKGVPHYGIGYGLLRYMYGPTARLFGATPPSDVFFSYLGTIPELPSLTSGDDPVQLDTDTAMPVREAVPGLGHAVELRVYRFAGVLHMDWWYDARRLEATAAQSLVKAFSDTLMELTREAIAEDEMASASEELTLVDLSSTDIGLGDANVNQR
jgi:phthiocerol/phenolphthiocerol synthesis type-I polyketide synthase E